MVLGNAMYAMLLSSTPTPGTFVGPMPVEDSVEQAPLTAGSDPSGGHHTSDVDTPPDPALEWDSGMHLTLGLAPMSTLHAEGFHPGVRFDIETGMAWERGRMKIFVGPAFHISQYYRRRKPGLGLDAMATFSLKHVYARVGAGTAMRIPAQRDLDDTRPMMGGLIGGGFVGHLDDDTDIQGRIGVDYDVRIDTTGRVAQTVMVTMQVAFGP